MSRALPPRKSTDERDGWVLVPCLALAIARLLVQAAGVDGGGGGLAYAPGLLLALWLLFGLLSGGAGVAIKSGIRGWKGQRGWDRQAVLVPVDGLCLRRNSDQGVQVALGLVPLLAAAEATRHGTPSCMSRRLVALAVQLSWYARVALLQRSAVAGDRRPAVFVCSSNGIDQGRARAEDVAGPRWPARKTSRRRTAAYTFLLSQFVPSIVCALVLHRSWLAVFVEGQIATGILRLLLSDAFRGSFTVGEAVLTTFIVSGVLFTAADDALHDVVRVLAHWEAHALGAGDGGVGRGFPWWRDAHNPWRRWLSSLAKFGVRYGRNTAAAAAAAAAPSVGTTASYGIFMRPPPMESVLQAALLTYALLLFLVCVPLSLHLEAWSRSPLARLLTGSIPRTLMRVYCARETVQRLSFYTQAVPSALVWPAPALLLALLHYCGAAVALRAHHIRYVSASLPSPLSALLQPVRVAWCLLRATGFHVGLATAWAVALYVSIFAAPPQSYRWRKIAARKYYHLLALLMFLPAFMNRSQEMDTVRFLAFATAAALALLMVVELLRITTNAPQHPSRAAAAPERRGARDGRKDQPGRDAAAPSHARHRATPLQTFMTSLIDERDEGRVIVSHLYLLAGCAAPVWRVAASGAFHDARPLSRSPRALDDAVSGMIILGVFDAFASLLGCRWGRRRWAGTKKTLEGSLSGFVLAWLTHWALYLGVVHSGVGERVAAAARMTAALAASTLFEALTTQIDNLVLPAFYYAMLSVVYPA
ncbi:hypothetical protein CDCA_CDCA01G0433 [Cyanidium caldarium]|uniref:dolichol kinase n=1 Tax=Cyanidium caldarium TaxID=2771 RepID=A0AAV9IR63_CYACA|nr:hypothetical protein CDCA_CDCA01G0433 [Cyanidium caldarium]